MSTTFCDSFRTIFFFRDLRQFFFVYLTNRDIFLSQLVIFLVVCDRWTFFCTFCNNMSWRCCIFGHNPLLFDRNYTQKSWQHRIGLDLFFSTLFLRGLAVDRFLLPIFGKKSPYSKVAVFVIIRQIRSENNGSWSILRIVLLLKSWI